MSAADAAGVFPKWVLLEPYVFRRDDDKSFPDDTVAPIRASGTTSWGAKFSIAFSLVQPPQVSRLYAQLPGFPGPLQEVPLEILATHRHLALVEVSTSTPCDDLDQNLFIFGVNKDKPSSSSLTALPFCTEPLFGNSLPRPRRGPSSAIPRELDSMSSGLWFGGDKEEFVVAELTLYVRTQGRRCTEAAADICFLRSSFNNYQADSCKWVTKRVPIRSAAADDLRKFYRWQTDAIIPFQQWLCWVDYHQGILFWDVLHPAHTISFLWFPQDKHSLASSLKTPCSGNGGVSVVDHGRLLKFAYVARHDGGLAFAEPEPSTGFTITCHTLLVLGDGSMDWKEDYTVTSDDLPGRFRRGIPMFPRVDIDKPHLVHFLFVEFGQAYEKMSLLCIDMSNKTVVSFDLYMDGNESLQTEDKDFIIDKCLSPTPKPFLPCEFPGFISRCSELEEAGKQLPSKELKV